MSAVLLPLIPLSIYGRYRPDKREICYVTKYNYSSDILCFTNLQVNIPSYFIPISHDKDGSLRLFNCVSF